MNNKIFIVVVLVSIFTTACAGPTMRIKKSENENLCPMGLFICSSTQGLDDKDISHRDFIISLSEETLTKLLNDKYDIQPLNNKIDYDEVFKKSSIGFEIDEKKIAQIARKEGCTSCLIVYYAVTDLQSPTTINTAILTPAGAYIPLEVPNFFPTFDEHSLKGGENDMTLHMRCSLYGWLISADTASALSKSHVSLAPFNKHIRDEHNQEQLYVDYVEYISSITKDMFSPMVENN